MLGLTTRAQRVWGWLPAWRCLSIHFQQQRVCREGKFPIVLPSRTHSSVLSPSSAFRHLTGFSELFFWPGEQPAWGSHFRVERGSHQCGGDLRAEMVMQERGAAGGERALLSGRESMGCLCQAVSRWGCVSRVS